MDTGKEKRWYDRQTLGYSNISVTNFKLLYNDQKRNIDLSAFAGEYYFKWTTGWLIARIHQGLNGLSGKVNDSRMDDRKYRMLSLPD